MPSIVLLSLSPQISLHSPFYLFILFISPFIVIQNVLLMYNCHSPLPYQGLALGDMEIPSCLANCYCNCYDNLGFLWKYSYDLLWSFRLILHYYPALLCWKLSQHFYSWVVFHPCTRSKLMDTRGPHTGSLLGYKRK